MYVVAAILTSLCVPPNDPTSPCFTKNNPLDFTPKLVVMATPLERSEVTLIIYSLVSISPERWVKICPVHPGIIGLVKK